MAGDWIKMRHGLEDDPSVIAIATRLDLDVDHVVGVLYRVWCWADRQTYRGHADNVSQKWFDLFTHIPGFANAMACAGWLKIGDSGITIPKFDAHISKSAKQRSLATKRQVVSRSRHGPSVTKTRQQRDQRREEKRRVENPTGSLATDKPPQEKWPPPKSRQPDLIWDTLVAIWWRDGVCKSERSRVNGLVRDLKKMGATPDEIHVRRARMNVWMKDIDGDTPESLRKWWGKLGQEAKPPVSARIEAPPGKYDD